MSGKDRRWSVHSWPVQIIPNTYTPGVIHIAGTQQHDKIRGHQRGRRRPNRFRNIGCREWWWEGIGDGFPVGEHMIRLTRRNFIAGNYVAVVYSIAGWNDREPFFLRRSECNREDSSTAECTRRRISVPTSPDGVYDWLETTAIAVGDGHRLCVKSTRGMTFSHCCSLSPRGRRYSPPLSRASASSPNRRVRQMYIPRYRARVSLNSTQKVDRVLSFAVAPHTMSRSQK